METAWKIAAQAAAEPAGVEKKGDFFHHGDDLYYFFFDGSKAVRLTRSSGAKEIVSLSPNGQHVAYRAGATISTSWTSPRKPSAP